MDQQVTELEAELEERHWWFVGRRHLFAKLLADAGLPRGTARLLDVGSGTGSNVRMCRDRGLGRCIGLDLSVPALEYSKGKGLDAVAAADANHIPARSGAFDAVLATDVIEHLDDDDAALRELARVCAPGGILLVTVPAFPMLWGGNDDVAHHRRRYRRPRLRQLVAAAGLELQSCFYFNVVLFVPILVVRRLMRVFRMQPKSEAAMSPRSVNRSLSWLFRRDVELSARLHPPFGVSLLALARKPVAPVDVSTGAQDMPGVQAVPVAPKVA
jgi:SAM-dependent methyltransferase